MRKMYLKEEEHNMCFENETRYVRQQSAIDDIAGKLGVVSYRPSYHGEKGDANTVLLYTVEDAEHNFQVDRQPFPIPEARRTTGGNSARLFRTSWSIGIISGASRTSMSTADST